MSYMEDIIKQNTAEPEGGDSTETNTAQPAEQPKTEDKAVQEPASEQEPEGKEPEQEPKQQKPDLSSIPKEEKAAHAFRKQLEKQRSKYEGIIDQMNGRFDKFEKVLEGLKAGKPEEPQKLREDFKTDDEYIAYLTKQGVDKALAEKRAEDEKAAAEKAEKQKADDEQREAYETMTATFQDNCRKTFQDQAVFSEFSAKVKKATANGLGEILDQAPAVRDFVFTRPEGPAILNAMLTDKDVFLKVMNSAGNPIMATITMYDLYKELSTKQAPAEQKQEPQQPPAPKGMPHIGKPGSRGDGPRNVMGSDRDIIKFLRTVR